MALMAGSAAGARVSGAQYVLQVMCARGARASVRQACLHACMSAGLWSAHECAPYPMGKLSISYTKHYVIIYPKMFKKFVID